LEKQPAERQQGQVILHNGPACRKIELMLISVPASRRPEDQERQNRDADQKELLVGFPHFAHFHRAHETANQHPAPKQRNILAGFERRHRRHGRLTQIIDDGAADRYFTADVHKNSHHTEHDVGIFKRADAGFHLAFTDMRQVN